MWTTPGDSPPTGRREPDITTESSATKGLHLAPVGLRAAGTGRSGASKDMSPRPDSASRATLKGVALRNSASVFAALGDETRLRLVAVLCAGGAMSIAQLTSGTDITRQAVTKHLSVLAEVGLVHDVKTGRERLWEFDPEQLEQARRSLEIIGQQWDHALSRLKLAIER